MWALVCLIAAAAVQIVIVVRPRGGGGVPSTQTPTYTITADASPATRTAARRRAAHPVLDTQPARDAFADFLTNVEAVSSTKCTHAAEVGAPVHVLWVSGKPYVSPRVVAAVGIKERVEHADRDGAAAVVVSHLCSFVDVEYVDVSRGLATRRVTLSGLDAECVQIQLAAV
jgi:hypothetical protein